MRAGVAPALALLAILALPLPGSAQEATAALDSIDVVVLPFANYTGRYEALDSVLPVFYSGVELGGLRVMTHEELRPLLRRHRTRVVGEISQRAMRILREETGAEFAVVGSIDVYEPDTSFEVLISARVIDLRDERVVSAVSVGRTVQETERVFGRGRASEIEEVIGLVVSEFLESIRPSLSGIVAPQTRYHMCGLVAVVPMDDYSSRRHGARVIENLLIAELIRRDWAVVEPGVLREVLLDHSQAARGGVSDEVLELLRRELGTCFVLTGAVEDFALAPAGGEVAVPHLDYGIRLIDAREMRLVDAVNESRNGLQGETVFGRGREYSMARLARASIEDLLEDLDVERARR